MADNPYQPPTPESFRETEPSIPPITIDPWRYPVYAIVTLSAIGLGIKLVWINFSLQMHEAMGKKYFPEKHVTLTSNEAAWKFFFEALPFLLLFLLVVVSATIVLNRSSRWFA